MKFTKYATSTAFGRQQEKEADEYSLKLLEKSSIHPNLLASVFRKLKEKNGDYGVKADILSTHPHINSRIKSSLCYKVRRGFKSKKLIINWEKVKESME